MSVHEAPPIVGSTDLYRSSAAGLTLTDLPTEYRRILGEDKQIPILDLLYFNRLVERHNVIPGRPHPDESIPKAFGRQSFFAAASDLVEHIDRMLENTSDNPVTQKRITDLCYLFMHIPHVKRESLGVQTEKMAHALPGFRQAMQDNPYTPAEPNSTRVELAYFVHAQNIMGVEMDSAARKLYPLRTDRKNAQNLGKIMMHEKGYNTFIIKDPWKQFAQLGNGTFINISRYVISQAVKKREDINEAVQREFLDKNGLGYRFMRMSLNQHKKLLLDPFFRFEDISDSFLIEPGLCPAALPGTLPDGTRTERPLAYEYAAIIVQHIPPINQR